MIQLNVRRDNANAWSRFQKIVAALELHGVRGGCPRQGECPKEVYEMATAYQGTATDVRETSALIASDKVEGTAVYRSNGEKVGRIERVMIDKRSGKVAYAVMSFGGFMGIGEDYYPLPWSLLTYNPKLEGYEVNIRDEQLKGAPKYSRHENWDWSDRARERKVFDYYGVPPYWGAV
jgi:hypothetical protein